MPFKYEVIDQGKIVFTRQGDGCARFGFISIGILFTIIGFCLIIFMKSNELPFSVIKYVVPIFGMGAVYVGIILPKLQRKSTPDEIIFDNMNGRVEIRQKDSEIKLAHIYYDEISDFIMKIKKQERSGGTSSSSSYSYHIYIFKKDGGLWELLKTSSERAALEEIVKLKLLINLKAKAERVVLNVNQSTKLKISQDYNKTEIIWRNSLGYGPFLLAAFALIFLTVGYSIVSSAHMPVFGYFIVGFIGLMFVIVIGGNARKMVKNARTIYSVCITSSSFDYIELDLALRVKNSKQIPLTQLHALSFSFDTDNALRKIFVYTHEQFKALNSLTVSFSIESIKNMYNFYTSLVSLDLQEFTAVEALHIENYLQQQIKEKSNIIVE